MGHIELYSRNTVLIWVGQTAVPFLRRPFMTNFEFVLFNVGTWVTNQARVWSDNFIYDCFCEGEVLALIAGPLRQSSDGGIGSIM